MIKDMRVYIIVILGSSNQNHDLVIKRNLYTALGNQTIFDY